MSSKVREEEWEEVFQLLEKDSSAACGGPLWSRWHALKEVAAQDKPMLQQALFFSSCSAKEGEWESSFVGVWQQATVSPPQSIFLLCQAPEISV